MRACVRVHACMCEGACVHVEGACARERVWCEGTCEGDQSVKVRV